jgi:tetratricopeptide (TPR) repeat protein
MTQKKNKRTEPFPLSEQPIVPAATAQRAQPLSLAQAMAMASKHQAEGNLQQSEQLLRQILQKHPEHADALHLLGIIAHQSGKTDMAINLIKKAVGINAEIALFHANLGEMLRLQKQLDESIQHGEKAVALDSKSPTAHCNLGITYYDKEDYERARGCQEKALRIDPNLPAALNNMGSILREEEKAEEAMKYYHRAVAANSTYLEPYNNLGLLMLEDNRPEEAVVALSSAVQQNPNYSDAQCNLGAAYSALEQFDKAFACYQTALKQRPEFAQAYTGIARIYQERDNYAEAEVAAKKAIEIEPDKPGSLTVLATIYLDTGLPRQAQEYFDKALAIDPEWMPAYIGMGHMHMEGGDFDAAESNFKKVLELDPELYGPRYSLAQAKKVSADDENFKILKERKDIENLPVNEAIAFNYAMGKCHDDVGEYETAFEYYIKGAEQKRATVSYDSDATDELIDRVIAAFDKNKLEQLRGRGSSSDVPIFILGMPRSGTTLTEQIISSHPDVFGAGELRDLKEIANQMQVTKAGQPVRFPDNMENLDAAALVTAGDNYVKGLQLRDPGAKHITDKMPGNYQMVGLIHLILPNAKIIHVNRSPIDTCVSCFSRLFRTNQYQSYDLKEQGLFYLTYHKVMEYWRSLLPAGSFYDLQYEELVKDTEAESRKLIDFCGLEWDDACLEFYKSKRAVKTASITQVRQPIYTSSMERWRRYDKFLGPLKEGLGDLFVDTAD